MGPSSFNDGDEQEVVELVVSVDASMGPSSFNDGDTPDSACTIRPDSGFNGAVVFQRRRSDGAGYNVSGMFSLQWGRRLSTTEI